MNGENHSHAGDNQEVVAGRQATEDAWSAMEAEFGLLTGAQVDELLGHQADGRSSYAAGEHGAGRLIGIRRGGDVVFPGFQFDRAAGQVRAVIPDLLEVVLGSGRTEENLAQWLCDPSGYLAGDRPVDHLDEPTRVLTAAEGHYGIEW